MRVDFIVILISFPSIILARCPPGLKVFPCKCDSARRAVICSSTKKYDLSKILADANYFANYIPRAPTPNETTPGSGNSSETVPEVLDYVMVEFFGSKVRGFVGLDGELLPKEFAIRKFSLINSGLVYVAPSAFTNAKELIVVNLARNRLSNLVFPGQGGLFDSFRTLSKLQAVILEGNNLQTVPDRAFDGHERLWYVDLASNRIGFVASRAFANLPFLTFLDLSNNVLSALDGSAFKFNGLARSSQLTLNLNGNVLSSSSFGRGLFRSLGRSVELSVELNSIAVLSEELFKELLDNQRSSVNLSGNDLNCERCENSWLVKNIELEDQVRNAICSDGRPIWSASELLNCSNETSIEFERIEVLELAPKTTDRQCPPGHYQCIGGDCIAISELCNQIDDCNQGDDETFCELATQSTDLIGSGDGGQDKNCSPLDVDLDEKSFLSINIKLTKALNSTILGQILKEIGVDKKAN